MRQLINQTPQSVLDKRPRLVQQLHIRVTSLE